MANVQHSTLTGNNLHEPKGVAAAAADRIYVSNGLGSGSWSQAGLDVLTPAAKAFQQGYYHVQHRESDGATGPSMSNATWNKRRLNSERSDPSSLGSVSSDEVTLPAGTYMCMGWAVIAKSSASPNYSAAFRSQLRLRDQTNNDTLLLGQSYSNETGITGTQTISLVLSYTQYISGVFTISEETDISLDNMAIFSSTAPTQGRPCGAGVGEVYADLIFWKIA